MIKGRGNVEFEDVRLGTGRAATREHKAMVSCTISLHRGERVQSLAKYWIDLKRRDVVAGLRYGIKGMRAGGIRRIVVPPQLGYGETGVPTFGIPPNAMLICEVELHELQSSHPIHPKLRLARERKQQQSRDEGG